MRTLAKIVSNGDKFCVESEDGSRKFGCYPSRQAAEKRLKQIEFFKHKNKGSEIMTQDQPYDGAFEGFGQVFAGDREPANCEQRNARPFGECGTIAGLDSQHILDSGDHFPVITEMQAQASMNRVMILAAVPNWYNGSLDDLRNDVYRGAKAAHPDLTLKVTLSADQVMALSDGQTPADTKLAEVKDPVDGTKDVVPQVERPTLKGAETVSSVEAQLAIATTLMEMLKKNEDALKVAMKLAKRLLDKGIDGEEFGKLQLYEQEEILRNLLHEGVTAGVDRRQELLSNLVEAKKKKEAKKKEEDKGGTSY